MLTLRPYQEAAKQAVYDYLRAHDNNPCVVIPTGGGKTPLLASICKDAVGLWNGRVLILAHVKELLQQAAVKLNRICPEVSFGIYSAGLKRRDTSEPVILAGIQSVYQRACDLDAFDLILVDEAHLIPPEGDGRYLRFLHDAQVVNPNVRMIGFTATPFRLKTGMICAPEGILNRICYEVSVRELIRDSYLCPLITKAGRVKADVDCLHVRGGEYIAGEVEDLMDQDELVEAACREIIDQAHDRQSVLIFASGIEHGQHVARILKEQHDLECGFLSGKTPQNERDHLLDRFRDRCLKYVCNVNVLTTGFDAPGVDCIVLLRPTLSAGLYYQMVGRDFRLHPDKQNCLVLDFGGNVLRHGPVDQIRVKERSAPVPGEAPAKECPECHCIIAAGYARCPDCGFAFPPPEQQKHEASATREAILSTEVKVTYEEVLEVHYRVHQKQGSGEDAPQTLRVDYRLGPLQWLPEFVCLEHKGYARRKAVLWWNKRSRAPVPDTAEEAVQLAHSGALAFVEMITVRRDPQKKYPEIIGHELGPIPEFPFSTIITNPEEVIPF